MISGGLKGHNPVWGPIWGSFLDRLRFRSGQVVSIAIDGSVWFNNNIVIVTVTVTVKSSLHVLHVQVLSVAHHVLLKSCASSSARVQVVYIAIAGITITFTFIVITSTSIFELRLDTSKWFITFLNFSIPPCTNKES